MNYFLRVLDTDWCDEFSTFGMKVYNELEHRLLVDALESIKDVNIYWGFGTNEAHEGKVGDFVKNTKVHLIDEDAKDTLLVLFPNIMEYGEGLCADIGDILEGGYDNEEYIDSPEIKEYWRWKNEQYQILMDNKCR